VNSIDFIAIGSNLSSPKRLPYPYMVYLILVEILGFPCTWKPIEKTLWSISVSFNDVPFLIEHGKFGLRVSSREPEIAKNLLQELLEILEGSFKITDKVFAEVVQKKIQSGEVTIPNSFHNLSDRYRFLRERAVEAFNSTPSPAKVIQQDASGNPTGFSHDPFKSKREGYYFAAAAIDAYFSRLEFILIAAYAFMIYSPGHDLDNFIRSIWSDKYLAIFDFNRDSRANKIYDKLIDIKRSYRNKFAHGGIDHDGGSLYVHFARIGAIPAKLSKGIKSTILPISEVEFIDVCKEFDECDDFFENGPISSIWTYLKYGFDIAFDSSSVELYKRYLLMDKDELESSLESFAYYLDAQQNMEW
jgi:hypothetical protein